MQGPVAARRMTGTESRLEKPRLHCDKRAVLAHHQTGQKEVCPNNCHLATAPDELSEHLAPLTPHRSLALNLGEPDPGKRFDGGTQRWPGDLATVGTYSNSTVKQRRLLVALQPTTMTAKPAPPTPCHSLALEPRPRPG